jgi:hypothetical protein
VFQKNPYKILELKTAMQSEIEAISTETITKVLNNFVLQLHEVYDLWVYHMEDILV